ncbi:16S rRNA (uracil(1498)-N(3))-methyltransferase [Wolbachia endosymbiont of Ctenocephalides felis wCfeJ]|uniref:16S rRNA (uracil(1498)-N(3))-methyltransferase n=1 Tax=Wolbachia endosymbiont of Ctenocephalides felis wCfeJ TaxID=2732594 RepID=UPI001447F46C|nr:16S rRNA (uracil(1498)-N(3))-methyltransferase [Wolbachia endosymbiont of Ctenocephalides felis wCfeJ]WCR57714.1 MAG: Ribosomal RNA small subunit methyltransferase E [Wolbachia endosymbiont of Ctenocephalides felis wCfeJ]
MEKIRLYVEEALSQGVSLVLNPRQSHYICNVMRLKEYDNVSFFNGKNGEWLGEIVDISHKLVKVTLKECTKRQQCEENLYLYCAIVKSAALSNIVRQATEMGVTCIQFILTEHTVVKNINLSRARLQAIEAAEQCGRTSVPEILSPIHFRDLFDSQDRSFILCDETGQGKSPNEVLKNKKNVVIIVGPEGGFSHDELSFADKFCQKLSLGKRILRVDTAVVAALALANARWTTHL